MSAKVCVIGLDCASPDLVFDLWADQLPTLRRIMEQGVYGPLESSTPPITVPAWMCMMTGKDPGVLGIYGFRNRKDHSYEGLSFASSRLIQEPTLWDVLAEHGKRSIVLGVPLTYPPRPLHGLLVSDFLAPDTSSNYTYPPELKDEIREMVGEYLFDTRQFRTEDKERLLKDIYAMTEQRFTLARHFLTTRPWDFFIMVEMGPDRLHHGFWRYFDPRHPKYIPGHILEHAIRDYYIALDAHISELLSVLDPDTRVLIVSDHGAKRMDGGICLNEWLIREGYLTLKNPVEGIAKFRPEWVDWTRTAAWGDGGYYGRIFLNVQEREPQGLVAPEAVEALKTELTEKLEALGDEHGLSIGTRVFRPEALYAACRNVAPDLIVYFGDLNWRSVGSLGHSSVWTHENDTGPDDANHAQHGIFLMAEAADVQGEREEGTRDKGQEDRRAEAPSSADGSQAIQNPKSKIQNPLSGLSLYDIAPTVLEAFGIAPPPGMGRNVIGARPSEPLGTAYTEEEEEELARRLEDLGYL